MTRMMLVFACCATLSACVTSETGSSGGGGPTEPTVYQTEAGAVTILPLSDTRQTVPVNRTLTDRCGANGMQPFVNQRDAVFFRYAFPDGTRFIRPGDAVTQDFNPRRLNFIIGNDGRVKEVRCG
ncbi:MAG: I78 family peptidase inhibitor [Pseudomonadota bacterium]